jgi:hypothetical protein
MPRPIPAVPRSSPRHARVPRGAASNRPRPARRHRQTGAARSFPGLAVSGVRDHESRAVSLGPAAARVLDEGTGIRLRVRVRHRWDVLAQLAVAAGRGNPGNVVGHRAAKNNPLGGQRRVGKGESHNQKNTWADHTLRLQFGQAGVRQPRRIQDRRRHPPGRRSLNHCGPGRPEKRTVGASGEPRG